MLGNSTKRGGENYREGKKQRDPKAEGLTQKRGEKEGRLMNSKLVHSGGGKGGFLFIKKGAAIPWDKGRYFIQKGKREEGRKRRGKRHPQGKSEGGEIKTGHTKYGKKTFITSMKEGEKC